MRPTRRPRACGSRGRTGSPGDCPNGRRRGGRSTCRPAPEPWRALNHPRSRGWATGLPPVSILRAAGSPSLLHGSCTRRSIPLLGATTAEFRPRGPRRVSRPGNCARWSPSCRPVEARAVLAHPRQGSPPPCHPDQVRGFPARRESEGSGAVRSNGSAPRFGYRRLQPAPKELRLVRPRPSVFHRPELPAARPRNLRAGESTLHGRPSPTGQNSRRSWSPEAPVGKARSIGGFSDPNRASGRSGAGRSRSPKIPTLARPEGWSGVPEPVRCA